MQECKIKFDITGTCEQEIRMLVDTVTIEELVEGLNSGFYQTTTEVSSNNVVKRTISQLLANGICFDIAEILSQTMVDDTIYTDFRVMADGDS